MDIQKKKKKDVERNLERRVNLNVLDKVLGQAYKKLNVFYF